MQTQNFNKANQYLKEARDFVNYEHDPADEIRHFIFKKVRTTKRGRFITTFIPVKKFVLVRGHKNPYKIGDDVQIIKDIDEPGKFKASGVRVFHVDWSGCDKSPSLIELEVISNFDPTKERIINNKTIPPLINNLASVYKLAIFDYDLRTKLNNWLNKLKDNGFRRSTAFHHLFVEPVKSNKLDIQLNQDDDFYNKNLNENQKKCIKRCIASTHPLSVIHGPPGTGKTTVIVEIIKKLMDNNQKILVCAHSNQAVDNVLDRLFELFQKDPPSFKYFGVRDDEMSLHNDVDIYYPDSLRVYRHNNVIEEFEHLNRKPWKDNKKKQKDSSWEKETKLVFCTLHTALDTIIGNFKADVAIIDEAGQTLDVDAWGALMRGKRCILAGDHHQLPPVIQKQDADKKFKTLGCKTLMERAIDGIESEQLEFLNIQHRMNEKIMSWSNQLFYNNNIVSANDVKNNVIKDSRTGFELPPVVVFNINGTESKKATSFVNESEAKAIADYQTYLLDYFGISKNQIGIISAYESQNKLMAKKIRNQVLTFNPDISAFEERREKRKQNLQKGKQSGPKICTVDGFQGSEMDVILVSLVRSNYDNNIGFLRDLRRLNVAATRARKHLVIFCNARTVSKDPEIKKLVSQNINYEAWLKNLNKHVSKKKTTKNPLKDLTNKLNTMNLG